MEREKQLTSYFCGLARAALNRGSACFSWFLDPAEMLTAREIASKQHVEIHFFGGYDDAERVIASFGDEPQKDEYPISCIEVSWSRHAQAPRHSDLLGAQMALGLERSCFGDIVAGEDRAYIFVDRDISAYVTANFEQAAHTPLILNELVAAPDVLPAPKGKTTRETVNSMRLDAVAAAAWNLSRASAQEAISREQVKLNHIVNVRTDARIEPGDLLSMRGHGRAKVLSQKETKKGRIAVEFFVFGNN